MAKWGEGDPRWIVEERPDATNVNNWHWTEKNACGWSQEKLKDLLMGLTIKSSTGDVGTVVLTEMEKLEGEAVVNNRKGKLIFFYEWDITMGWKGRLTNGNKGEIEGKMHIPNLSEENDVEEIEVNFTTKDKDTEAEILRNFLYVEGKDKVREQLKSYISLLKEEFSKGMILPKKDETSKSDKDQIANLSSGFNKKMQMNHVNSSTVECSGDKAPKSTNTTTINSSHNFQCTGEEIYKALTDVQMASAFTNGPAKIEAKKNGKFELFGGNVHGEFTELVPNKKIVQRWRSKQWPAGHFSIVTLDIDQQQDHTVIRLKQTDVPQSEAEGTRENWERFYWESIKRTFGWGTFFM